jgi:sec-independent protein translocase protein TatA
MLFASMLGPQEVILLLIIGVVLFGKKLPDVGRSVGKALSEFRRAFGGVEDELERAINRPESVGYRPPSPPQRIAAPKFQEDAGLVPPSA